MGSQALLHLIILVTSLLSGRMGLSLTESVSEVEHMYLEVE